MPLIRLIYVSNSAEMLAPQELKNILQVAQHNNEHLNITGMLLYASGNFIQILEGEETQVRELYAKIAKDRRHNNIIMLDDSPIKRRTFPRWTMGFKLLSAADKAELLGYTDFLDRRVPPEEFLNFKDDVAELLYQFAESNQR